MLRSGVYAGALITPTWARWDASHNPAVVTGFAGFDTSGNWSWNTLAYSWGPFVAFGFVDWGLSKLGVYRRAGRAMRALSLG